MKIEVYNKETNKTIDIKTDEYFKDYGGSNRPGRTYVAHSIWRYSLQC